MQVTNTNELSAFMGRLKTWAEKNSYETLLSAIISTEKTSFTASELIIKYGEVLKNLKKNVPANLPPELKNNIDLGIEVSSLGVQTVEYEETKRSLFSLG